jgi:hypothetical protein
MSAYSLPDSAEKALNKLNSAVVITNDPAAQYAALKKLKISETDFRLLFDWKLIRWVRTPEMLSNGRYSYKKFVAVVTKHGVRRLARLGLVVT